MTARAMGLIFVLLSVVCEALGQIAFKRAADRKSAPAAPEATPDSSHWLAPLREAFTQPGPLLAGVGCFVVEGVLWTLALKFLPVSVAHPAGSLELVVVAILSRILLKESVNRRRLAGILLILAGVALVGTS